MDIADLYDFEIAKIGPIWQKLMREFSTKPNTKENLSELSKRAQEEFIKIGLVIELNTAPAIIVDPRTMESGSPEIIVIGRVPGTESSDGFDHELKRHEVLRSRERGEDYLGQKEK